LQIFRKAEEGQSGIENEGNGHGVWWRKDEGKQRQRSRAARQNPAREDHGGGMLGQETEKNGVEAKVGGKR